MEEMVAQNSSFGVGVYPAALHIRRLNYESLLFYRVVKIAELSRAFTNVKAVTDLIAQRYTIGDECIRIVCVALKTISDGASVTLGNKQMPILAEQIRDI
jgi:hypothetical protein